MCTRLSAITSDTYTALGSPPSEWLSLRELWFVVKSVSEKYLQAIQQSDQNQIIAVEEFSLNDEREYDLTAVISRGVPAWMERQVRADDAINGGKWELIPVVNLHNLETYRNDGRKACSFFGDAYGGIRARFSYSDDLLHRVWFDPESAFDITQDSESVLPSNFNAMLKFEAGVLALAMMEANAIRRTPEGKPFSEQQIGAWRNLAINWREQLGEWKVRFNTWTMRSRGAQTSGNRPRQFRRLYND
jgi:hypothetical protein